MDQKGNRVMSGNKQSKNDISGELDAIAAGLKQHFAGQTLTFSNVTVKVDDLIAEFGAFRAQLAAIAAAHAVYTQQVAEGKRQRAQVLASVRGVKSFLRAMYGVGNETLADFGMTPRVPRKASVPTKAAALVKSAATRTARHTMGSKQKAAIHAAPAPAPSGGSTGGGGSPAK
jgi:hypothetical protein